LLRPNGTQENALAKKSLEQVVAKYIGDYLREAAVLVIVFTLLDRFINDKQVTGWWLALTLGTSLLALSLGMWFGIQGGALEDSREE
jgi:hypothetical protein